MARLGVLLVALLVTLPRAPCIHAEDLGLAVITHPSRAVSLSRSDLRRLFLKQRRFWSDGAAVIAVNQTAATPVRTAFERIVFGREASGLQIGRAHV